MWTVVSPKQGNGWNICYLMDLHWLRFVLELVSALQWREVQRPPERNFFQPWTKGQPIPRNGGFNIQIYKMSKPRRLSFEQYPKWQPDKESYVTQVKDQILWRLNRRERLKNLERWNQTLHLLHGGNRNCCPEDWKAIPARPSGEVRLGASSFGKWERQSYWRLDCFSILPGEEAE